MNEREYAMKLEEQLAKANSDIDTLRACVMKGHETIEQLRWAVCELTATAHKCQRIIAGERE